MNDVRRRGILLRRPSAAAVQTLSPTFAERVLTFRHPLIAYARRWRTVLVAFVASRFVIALLMGFSSMIVVPGEHGPRGGFIGILTQGQGVTYLEIAQSGYAGGESGRSLAGFFPFYPFLVQVVAVVFRDAAFSAILISNVALLAAGILLKELLDRHHHDSRTSSTAVAFLMFGPVSFYFSGAYVESTFLMLTLAACFAAVTRRWSIAALTGALASMSHVLGVFVLLPLVFEFLNARRRDQRPNATSAAHALLLAIAVPLGLAAFMGFCWFRFGDALAPIRASEFWLAGFVAPWDAISATTLIPPFYRAFTLLMLCSAAALLCAGIFAKVRASYLVYASVLIVLYTCSPALPSLPRWLSIVFPLYIVLAVVTRRIEWLYEPLLACSFTLLAFCTIMAANGHWIG